jgi:hypothetical protein
VRALPPRPSWRSSTLGYRSMTGKAAVDGHPPGDRRLAHRRHQDAQGRHPRPAALRLRRAPRSARRHDQLGDERPQPAGQMAWQDRAGPYDAEERERGIAIELRYAPGAAARPPLSVVDMHGNPVAIRAVSERFSLASTRARSDDAQVPQRDRRACRSWTTGGVSTSSRFKRSPGLRASCAAR